MNYKPILLLIGCCIYPALGHAQDSLKTTISYDITSEAAVGTGDFTAYQLATNRHHVLGTRSNTAYIRGAVQISHDLSRDWKLSGGIDAIGSAHADHQAYLQQCYANLSYQKFFLEVGEREQHQVLRDEDREERAEERDVERDRRRQAQGQQKSGQGRRAVTDGVRLFADLVKYELREYRSRDGDQDHQQRGNAEIDDADHGRRKKRRDHAVHDQVRPKPAADMGAGGQIHRCIHFLPPISARFLARISALVCLNSCISGRFAGQIKVQVPQAMQSGP